MRLGQFARKYDIRVQDLISYLESDSEESIHSNTKLSDVEEADILDFFGIEPESEPREVEKTNDDAEELEDHEKTSKDEPEAPVDANVSGKEWDAEDSDYAIKQTELPITPEDDIALAEGELESVPADLTTESTDSSDQSKKESTQEKKEAPKEDEVIQTDKLLEMLESEEKSADLEKIKLIKAPKKELSGLKVLGKVDLPEPKKKPESEPAEKTDSNQSKSKRNQRPPLSEEEREKRRLRAKRKKEAYEARQEKRKKEQESKQLKELKAKHYKQKLQKPQAVKKKSTAVKSSHLEPVNHQEKTRSQPKTWLGKWWRWMNT